MTMKRIKKYILGLLASASIFSFSGCNGWLDIVPDDGVATLEMAFYLRSSAIKYLATCYSYMTNDGAPGSDPAMLGGDEMWDLVGRAVTNTSGRVPNYMFGIARGQMSSTNVIGADWATMYRGIRCCDILVENVDDVPDMTNAEKMQWKAEAKFLKAYYHFNLIRKYGPVPIVRQSLDMDSSIEEVRVYRDPIDSCFAYIFELLDEAQPYLPLIPLSDEEYGRATQCICAAFKAKVAVYAASPLFNGNQDFYSLVDNRGEHLFPTKTDEEKLKAWKYAMDACESAYQLCTSAGYSLFDKEAFRAAHPAYSLDPAMARDLILRCSFYDNWNQEIIWANTQVNTSYNRMFQQLCHPNFSTYSHSLACYQFIGVPLKIAEQFYTRNGLPIGNDLEWAGANPYELKTADANQSLYLEPNYTTVRLNFYREPRYYSSLGFDGGTWISMMSDAQYIDPKPEDLHVLKCRIGQVNAKSGRETGPVTGLFPKKILPHYCNMTAANSFTSYRYAYPMIRLTDLYLLYAEAINETEGPEGEHSELMFALVDSIRTRAGIPDVKTSWDEYSNSPRFYNSKVGMRDIIHAERLNELAFESQRFWDIRRWKEAPEHYQKNIYGFTVSGSTPEDYYVKTLLQEQNFGLKDYFWPIAKGDIEVNPNLVQNIGW